MESPAACTHPCCKGRAGLCVHRAFPAERVPRALGTPREQGWASPIGLSPVAPDAGSSTAQKGQAVGLGFCEACAGHAAGQDSAMRQKAECLQSSNCTPSRQATPQLFLPAKRLGAPRVTSRARSKPCSLVRWPCLPHTAPAGEKNGTRRDTFVNGPRKEDGCQVRSMPCSAWASHLYLHRVAACLLLCCNLGRLNNAGLRIRGARPSARLAAEMSVPFVRPCCSAPFGS